MKTTTVFAERAQVATEERALAILKRCPCGDEKSPEEHSDKASQHMYDNEM